MKASYFVFKKMEDETTANLYQLTDESPTLSALRGYLNARLNDDGVNARDFLIIRGREEKISAVKIVAEFETVES